MHENDNQRFSPNGESWGPPTGAGNQASGGQGMPLPPPPNAHSPGSHGQPGPTPPGYARQMPPPPPVIPFYPLTLGALFSGTFLAIRANPKVLFTISLVTTGILGLLSGLASAFAVGVAGGPDPFPLYNWGPHDDTRGNEVARFFWQGGADNVVSVVSAAAMLLVTGMLVLTIANSVVGKKLDLHQAWEDLKPLLWRLIGTALLVWLIMVGATLVAAIPILLFGFFIFTAGYMGIWISLLVVYIIAAIATLIWLSVRLYFASQAVVLESASPTTAIARSWQLTRNAFWRVAGRVLLMGFMVGVAASVVTGMVTAFILVTTSFGPTGVSVFFVTFVTMLATGSLLPVSAAYETLMYIDERMRKENLGITLQEMLLANRGY